MKKRTLGRTGLDIAPVVLGGNVFGWTIDERESQAVLDGFVDLGFDAIDTADCYSAWADGNTGGESETIIGDWLKARPGMRDRVKIFTKVGSVDGGPHPHGLSEAHILQATEKSLKRLGIEQIDLYFAHWPDPAGTSYEETLGAFDKLIRAGKVKSIGVSNVSAAQLEEALSTAAHARLPAYGVLQPEYNLYDRDGFEGALQDAAIRHGLGVITYFSLASGFLTGKYRSRADMGKSQRGGDMDKYFNERGDRILKSLDDVAAARAAEPADVALAWLMAKPGVTAPIASATRPRHLESFRKAAELDLSAQEIDVLDRAGA